MIARVSSVCYSDSMRKMVVGLLIFFGVTLIFVSNLASELSFFLIAGKIPYTTLFLSPSFMMVFWIIVVPMILIFRRTLANLLWNLVEKVGKLHQLHLNRHFYRSMLTKRYSPSVKLYFSALLSTLSMPIKNSITSKENTRRRYAAIQI